MLRTMSGGRRLDTTRITPSSSFCGSRWPRSTFSSLTAMASQYCETAFEAAGRRAERRAHRQLEDRVFGKAGSLQRVDVGIGDSVRVTSDLVDVRLERRRQRGV